MNKWYWWFFEFESPQISTSQTTHLDKSSRPEWIVAVICKNISHVDTAFFPIVVVTIFHSPCFCCHPPHEFGLLPRVDNKNFFCASTWYSEQANDKCIKKEYICQADNKDCYSLEKVEASLSVDYWFRRLCGVISRKRKEDNDTKEDNEGEERVVVQQLARSTTTITTTVMARYFNCIHDSTCLKHNIKIIAKEANLYPSHWNNRIFGMIMGTMDKELWWWCNFICSFMW